MKTSGLIVDLFAGGGGASLGFQQALGRSPDIAINHNREAIEMHARNHPDCKHYTQDVCEVKPREVTRGRAVWWLHASPDCRHFSRAKGARPVEKKIRSLAWVVCRWAAEAEPSIITLENVREFEDWGPLVPRWECRACKWHGTEGATTLARTRRRCPKCNSLKVRETVEQVPDPKRKGLTFRRFVGRLKALGYVVEWRSLNAADFGAPTHRRRLFLVARRDGLPISWPAPTHADPKKIAAEAEGPSLFGDAEPLKPWRTAASCIDWSLPCPSIFDRKKPLAEATMKRIAMGIKRYVIDAAPFIVPLTHHGERKANSIDEPLPTVTGANRGEQALVTPVIASLAHGGGGTFGNCRERSVESPLGTVHAGGGNYAVAAPLLARLGQTGGNGSYTQSVDVPVSTVTSKAEHLLVAPILAGVGGADGAGKPKSVNAPSSSCLPNDRRALVSAFLARHFGGVVGCEVERPLPTVTAKDHHSLVSAFMTKFRPGDANQSLEQPAPTVTANSYIKRPGGAAPIGLAAANLVHLKNNTKPTSPDEPIPTVLSGGNHAALVYSFLVKYFGTAIGQFVDAPLGTATGKDRFGVIIVHVDGEPYVIVDIGMRMLSPRELARAQGFTDDYILTGTKTSQVHKIGNSVSPPVARALVEANMAATLAGVA